MGTSGRGGSAATERKWMQMHVRASVPVRLRRMIPLVRWWARIFYQALALLTFNVLLIALDCQTFHRPDAAIGQLQGFPDVRECQLPFLRRPLAAFLQLCAPLAQQHASSAQGAQGAAAPPRLKG